MEVDLTSVATINSTGNAAPGAGRARQDRQRGADRRPPVLPLAAGHARDAAGGDRHRRRHDQVPRRLPRAGHRRPSACSARTTPPRTSTPWSDAPAEIGVAPDGGAGNPADPRLPFHSSTQIDLDLFDIIRDVTGPLSYGFSFYKIMPQLVGAPAPTIQRGPINAAAPPTAPAQPANTLRVASFNVENYFPVGKENDGHTITQAEYNERTEAIVRAIQDRLGRAGRRRRAGGGRLRRRRQRAHRPGDRAGQLHGLHHDQQRRPRDRDRLPGQGRHDGHQRAADRGRRERRWANTARVRPRSRASCSTAPRTRSTSRRATCR